MPIIMHFIIAEGELTWETIRNYSDNVEKNIKFALSNQKGSPVRPVRPILASNHSAEEAIKYGQDLALYENKMLNLKDEIKDIKTFNGKIDAAIVDYIKHAAGLHKIPAQYRDKAYRVAYEEAHSQGYYEVYMYLSTIIEIFEP